MQPVRRQSTRTCHISRIHCPVRYAPPAGRHTHNTHTWWRAPSDLTTCAGSGSRQSPPTPIPSRYIRGRNSSLPAAPGATRHTPRHSNLPTHPRAHCVGPRALYMQVPAACFPIPVLPNTLPKVKVNTTCPANKQHTLQNAGAQCPDKGFEEELLSSRLQRGSFQDGAASVRKCQWRPLPPHTHRSNTGPTQPIQSTTSASCVRYACPELRLKALVKTRRGAGRYLPACQDICAGIGSLVVSTCGAPRC